MARKIINSLQKGKIKVVIIDFWRSRNEKGIDIEIYANEVLDGKVSLAKASWEK